jgi:hypothetical protein
MCQRCAIATIGARLAHIVGGITMRWKQETAHEECQRLTAEYLQRGGRIHRNGERVIVSCSACPARRTVDVAFLARFGAVCTRSGGRMRAE